MQIDTEEMNTGSCKLVSTGKLKQKAIKVSYIADYKIEIKGTYTRQSH